ncbi:NucA/NucB deoxyribonuclease domain-containing protein [Streptomyces formicae]
MATIAALTVAIGGVSATAATAREESPREVMTFEQVDPPSTRIVERPSEAKDLPSDASFAERRRAQIPKESPEALMKRARQAKKFHATSPAASKSARGYIPPVSAVECQKINGADNPDNKGSVLDHWNWCQVGNYKITLKDCGRTGCTFKGEFRYRLSTLGIAKNGAREVVFVSFMDNMQVIGDSAFRTTPLTLDMTCKASQGSACKGDPRNKQTQPISMWITSPSAFFNFSSPETGATGTDKISWYGFQGTSTITGAAPVQTGKNGFRCDSASYIAQSKGCVFDLTNELFYDMNVADPDVNETSQHILDAQSGRVPTFPDWAGKTVPGSATSGEPLNRIYHDKSHRRANHRQAVATCKEHFGDDYPSRGLECDEYPFQSTAQGAAPPNTRYSARALDEGDNGRGGVKLGQFYDRQRIIDSDPFFVIVLQ